MGERQRGARGRESGYGTGAGVQYGGRPDLTTAEAIADCTCTVRTRSIQFDRSWVADAVGLMAVQALNMLVLCIPCVRPSGDLRTTIGRSACAHRRRAGDGARWNVWLSINGKCPKAEKRDKTFTRIRDVATVHRRRAPWLHRPSTEALKKVQLDRC